MAANGEVCAGLLRHKTILLRELCDTNILDVLVKKGLFSVGDLENITSAPEVEKCNFFVEIVSKQSGAKLSDLCSVLEKECPKLAKELINDRNRLLLNGYHAADSAKENMVMSHNLHRFVQILIFSSVLDHQAISKFIKHQGINLGPDSNSFSVLLRSQTEKLSTYDQTQGTSRSKMPSALNPGPFSQPEWSDSSDSSGPPPLPQLGYFVPVRCRCGCDRTTLHACRRYKRESPRSRRSVSQCSCNSMSRRSSVASPLLTPAQLPPLNNTMEMYVEPVVEDVSPFLFFNCKYNGEALFCCATRFFS